MRFGPLSKFVDVSQPLADAVPTGKNQGYRYDANGT